MEESEYIRERPTMTMSSCMVMVPDRWDIDIPEELVGPSRAVLSGPPEGSHPKLWHIVIEDYHAHQ